MPSLHAETTKLTPLEIAVEDIRRAYLKRLLVGQRETWPLMHAIQRHRDLGLSGRDRIHTMRLAFRMAHRDYLILRPLPPGFEPKPLLTPELRVAVTNYLQHIIEQPAPATNRLVG